MKKKNLKKSRWASAALTIVLALGLLSGCGSANESSDTGSEQSDASEAADEGSSSLNTTTHLNIATQPTPGYIALEIVRDNGLLETALAEAGYDDVEVTFTDFESGPPENESFAAGEQDIGVMGCVPGLSAIASGQDRTIIGIPSNGGSAHGVLVTPDSDIEEVADLEGKTIGLVVGSICQDFLDTLLEANGLDSSDVELVNLNISEQQTALINGDVDAISTWTPTLTTLQEEGYARLVADGDGIYMGENTTVCRTEYLEENPDIVEIYQEVYQEAVELLENDLEGYAEEYSEYYGIEADLLLTMLELNNYPCVITEDDVTELQGTADFLYEDELITSEIVVADHVVLSD